MGSGPCKLRVKWNTKPTSVEYLRSNGGSLYLVLRERFERNGDTVSYDVERMGRTEPPPGVVICEFTWYSRNKRAR